jgi:hypothetical protein
MVISPVKDLWFKDKLHNFGGLADEWIIAVMLMQFPASYY